MVALQKQGWRPLLIDVCKLMCLWLAGGWRGGWWGERSRLWAQGKIQMSISAPHGRLVLRSQHTEYILSSPLMHLCLSLKRWFSCQKTVLHHLLTLLYLLSFWSTREWNPNENRSFFAEQITDAVFAASVNVRPLTLIYKYYTAVLWGLFLCTSKASRIEYTLPYRGQLMAHVHPPLPFWSIVE